MATTTIRLISNTRAKLECASKGLVLTVDGALSFTHPGYERSPAFVRYKKAVAAHKKREQEAGRPLPKPDFGWDGKTHLLVEGSHTFPIGLLDRVRTICDDAGHRVKILDERQGPPTSGFKASARLPRHSGPSGARSRLLEAGPCVLARPPETLIPLFDKDGRRLKDGKLREDQIDAIMALLKAERGIVWAATGAGKTETAIGAVKWLLDNGWPGDVLFLSDRKKLLRDTQKRFERAIGDDYTVGMMAEGVWQPDSDVIIASVSTLAHKANRKKLKKALANVTVVIVDECHHVGADSWYNVLKKVPARLRFGLSGSPLDRADNRNLKVIGSLGEVVYEIRAKKLIDMGVLARPTVHILHIDKPDDIEEMDWDFAYAEGITGNLYRNTRIVAKAGKLAMVGKRCLVLVQELAHGWNLQRAFKDKRIDAKFVHGQSKGGFVDMAVEELNDGTRKVLIASPIFREGVDIPAINALFIGDGGKSVIKAVQQVGRGLRRKKGDNTVQVYDFFDDTNEYLREHSQKRIAVYKREGFTVVQE